MHALSSVVIGVRRGVGVSIIGNSQCLVCCLNSSLARDALFLGVGLLQYLLVKSYAFGFTFCVFVSYTLCSKAFTPTCATSGHWFGYRWHVYRRFLHSLFTQKQNLILPKWWIVIDLIWGRTNQKPRVWHSARAQNAIRHIEFCKGCPEAAHWWVVLVDILWINSIKPECKPCQWMVICLLLCYMSTLLLSMHVMHFKQGM